MMCHGLRFTLTLLLSVALLRPAISAQDKKNSAADSDVLLQAMKTELDRSKASLKLDQVTAPYYIEYRVFDADIYDAEAAFGALRVRDRGRVRILRVVVRLGDYKQDSYYRQGLGAFNLVPTDNDPIAIRHQIWEATDQAYKAAAQALTAKQAQLKQLAAPEIPVDDFSHAQPLQSIEPLAKLDFVPERWLGMLQAASAVYRDDLTLHSVASGLKFQAINRYFVNSEGTAVRSGYNIFEMSTSLTTQASDGMRLDRSHVYSAAYLKDLPSAAEFQSNATKMLTSLKELSQAPVADEEYRGPVLFSAEASATLMADLVGEGILGRKPELGKNARTTGPFAASYKSRVLPDFLSVVDDPTIASLSGQPLLGHYGIDDEGVPAARVSVIENGKLVNYLIGREPIRDFPASNGHGRAMVPTSPPGPSVGNLVVSVANPSSSDDLKKKLIELCRQRDLPYGYFVDTFGGRLVPRLLYKVWVKDGHEELVRGGAFGDLDDRALRTQLVAAGNDMYVDSQALNIPHSVVSPSLLFDELEVKRLNANQDKLPEYPAPPLVSAK